MKLLFVLNVVLEIHATDTFSEETHSYISYSTFFILQSATKKVQQLLVCLLSPLILVIHYLTAELPTQSETNLALVLKNKTDRSSKTSVVVSFLICHPLIPFFFFHILLSTNMKLPSL